MSLLSAAQSIIEDISAVFFPPSCGLCDQPVRDRDAIICGACRDCLISIPEPICEICGMPLSADVPPVNPVCGACLSAPPPYSKARFGVVHAGNVRHALIGFKYYGQIHRRAALARILTERFDHYFSADNAEMIIPMPMHPRRLIERGFNQVVLLGESLERHTGISMCRTVLTKIRDTPPQVGLPRAQRVKNIKGSFGINGNERIRGKRVLLVDDVSTTGSTISEASKTLMHSGASRVEVIVLALRTQNVISEDVSGKEQSDGIDDTGGL